MENNKVSQVRTRSVALAWLGLFRRECMEDLDKTIEGYKQLYQFLIEFSKMNTFKRKIVIKQLEEQIKTLEKEKKGVVENG